MKSLLVLALYKLLRIIVSRYVDQDLFDRVSVLVIKFTEAAMSGDEKRAAVHEVIKSEWEDIPDIVVNATIEVVLLKEIETTK